MSQQLEANRSYVDNLLAQIKEQTAKTQELYNLRMVDRGIIAEQKAEIITLREQRDRLTVTLKELADLAEIRTTPHEHVPGIGNAVARARSILREVEGGNA